ncbi:hypothetical protein F5876DRAFT_64857 [Lentinula aff. lateritia]|uniref:Uncharacterized protein n=1 Tax=Lentinula aff. lateritia TaxID=2804960 RepID=A0ACC1U3I3_9AGAR|nr:hypothetical protein F5876DRAFT_64857 [Lentinula aff. lateritia]
MPDLDSVGRINSDPALKNWLSLIKPRGYNRVIQLLIFFRYPVTTYLPGASLSKSCEFLSWPPYKQFSTSALLAAKAAPVDTWVPAYKLGEKGARAHFHSLASMKFEQEADEVFVGVRVVLWQKAYEYNVLGTLSAIPASGLALGEGAYLSPGPGMFSPAKNDPEYWTCMVFANKEIIYKETKVYVTESEDGIAHLTRYLNAAIPGLAERHDRILLSNFENNLMMLIPPPFLVKTPSLHYYVPVYGTNRLKLRVRCYPPDELPHSIPTAEWQKWPNVMWKPPTLGVAHRASVSVSKAAGIIRDLDPHGAQTPTASQNCHRTISPNGTVVESHGRT